jgi:hypothetical protein
MIAASSGAFMELQQFVAETLKQIVAGIVDAQSAMPSEVRVCPRWERNAVNKEDMVERGTGRRVEEVAFDVAVTAHEGKETKGGVGVVAGVFALGSQGQSSATNQSITRIKFSVPVVLPIQD